MAENINNKTIFSLLEVTKSIQKTISVRYKTSFWVKAEMNKLNFYNQSGHCYPDLVEKRDGKVIAQMRANLWKDDYLRTNNNFIRVLNEPLKDGIKILFLAKISFEPSHGLALQIIDIDPAYTMGDLEKEKQETLNKLQRRGEFNINKSLKLPLLPQRIAIISVESSKGYKDFLGKIDNNPWGFAFFHMLFPSVLQGEKIIQSISAQLKNIKKVKSHFDVVAIIRGGGGDVGLSSYNNYKLAKEIALFPLPVLTGIGHITNETVVELVSHKNLITPTDLANFLTEKFHSFSTPVKEAQQKITDKCLALLNDEKVTFKSEVKLFRSVSENLLIKNRHELKVQARTLFQQSHFVFKNEKEHLRFNHSLIKRGITLLCNNAMKEVKGCVMAIQKDIGTHLKSVKSVINQQVHQVSKSSHLLLHSGKEKITTSTEKISDKSSLLMKNETIALNNIKKNIDNMSPDNVLKRGYSITLLRGKAVKNVDTILDGDTINTLLFEGSILSTVKSSLKDTNHE